MAKMQFNSLASNGLTRYVAPGSTDISAITNGFFLVGRSANESDVVKTMSKKQFVETFKDRFESKSQCAKAFYGNLAKATDAAVADFAAKARSGHRITQIRNTKAGTRHYTLALPKADTAGSESANDNLRKENDSLKAALAKMQAQMAELTAAITAAAK